jgi:filamentous hemagglutinin
MAAPISLITKAIRIAATLPLPRRLSSAYGVSAFTGNGMESTDNKVYGYENIVVTGGADSPFMTQNLEVSGVYATNVNTEKTATNTVVLSGGISATGDVKADGSDGNYTSNDKVYGVSADGAGSANDVTMAGNIEAKAGQTNTNYATIAAIDADNSGKNTITGVKNISATEVAGKDATVYGIHSNDSGTNNVNVGATTKMGTLTATIADTDAGEEADAYGIMAENSSQNTVDGLGAITVTGNRTAYGIDATAKSTNAVNLEGDADRGDIVVTAKTGVANGVSATGTATGASSNTVYGYNNISVTGATSATGIEATGNDENNTATNTVAMGGALTTKSTTGPSTGITATDYAANTVTGVTNIDAAVTESGDATGITATNGTNSVNEDQTTYTSYIKATTPSGTATGIVAKSTGLQPASNIVAGVTDITAEGSGNATVIQATGNDEINTATNTVNMNGAILATSTVDGAATGIGATTYGKNIVSTVTDITAKSGQQNGGQAAGVDATDHSTNEVTMTGNLTATAEVGGDVYGVHANDNSTNTIIGTKDINVTTAGGNNSNNAYGIDAVKDSTNNVNNTEETKTAEMGSLTVSSDSGAAYGVNADATAGTGTTANYVGGLIKIDVTSTDADAYGVNATGGTSTTNNSLNDVHVTGDITVTATLDWGESASAYGVNADKYGSNTVEGSKNISATATVGDAYAVKASGTEAVNKINETAKSDKGSVTATTDNGAAYAIQATQGGTNTLGGVTSVDAEGTTGAAGIDASTNSANTVAMNGDLTAKSTGTDDANPVYAVNANNSSTNNVTGTKNITATDAYGNAYGINATKGSTNNVNKDVTETLGDMTVSSDNGAAYGITANAFSTTINKPTTNNVGGLGKVTVTSTEDTATGIDAAGGNADNLAANNVNLTGDITVEAANQRQRLRREC